MLQRVALFSDEINITVPSPTKTTANGSIVKKDFILHLWGKWLRFNSNAFILKRCFVVSILTEDFSVHLGKMFNSDEWLFQRDVPSFQSQRNKTLVIGNRINPGLISDPMEMAAARPPTYRQRGSLPKLDLRTRRHYWWADTESQRWDGTPTTPTVHQIRN